MTAEVTVFVIDDDEQARKSVCALVCSMGVRSEAFASAEDFLARYCEGRRGCLVIDVRMPGMSGLELQQRLLERRVFLPVIVLTAYARTPLTVQAMRAGAVTLLEKPYADDELWEAIRMALGAEAQGWTEQQQQREIGLRLGQLTADEREVMDRVVGGVPNKTIARELGVSVRTVENRRHRVLAKMQVRTVAELVNMVVLARRANRE
jgi:two-component system, LuxR family, response regulator FixJ